MKFFRRTTVLFLIYVSLASFAYAGPLDNCTEYTKYGIPSDHGTLLCRKGYALAHNPDHKTPDWVAEHLTKEKASATMGRKNYFKADPDLPQGEHAEKSDYLKSGYDQGHMAPAGDMRWDLDAYKESYYLSNMAPQIGPRMNRGIWKDLEEKVRDWALERGELYIYTGPIYDEEQVEIQTIGKNNVAVPTSFYKVIFDPVLKEAIAFIMPNEELNTADMPKYIVSVNKVEKETGLDFLSSLSKDEQQKIEARKAKKIWQ